MQTGMAVPKGTSGDSEAGHRPAGRYPYKRSHLVALRPTKISANDPPSTWWPGER
jgi:hypothetical protein